MGSSRKRAEHTSGEFYTGVTGYFDGRKLDSRRHDPLHCQKSRGGQLVFKVEVASPSEVTPRSEYNEMETKVYVLGY